MSKIEKVFSPFRKVTVKVYRIKNSSAYSSAAETEFVCSVLADVQPYGGSLDEKQFGLSAERYLKLYCGDCDEIREGRYAEIDGAMYRIKSVERWNMGVTAVIEGGDLNENKRFGN